MKNCSGPDLEWEAVVPGRKEHWGRVLEQIPSLGMAGYVAEFGVYRGTSLRMLAETFFPRTVFGFDSFRGLPKAWDVGDGGRSHPAGHFATSLPEILPNVVLVVGEYSNTLPRFFSPWDDHRFALVHVDCDLYESAECVLRNVGPYLAPGSIVVFDEIGNWDGRYPTWEEGEWRALQEFRRPWRPLFRTEAQQASIVISG